MKNVNRDQTGAFWQKNGLPDHYYPEMQNFALILPILTLSKPPSRCHDIAAKLNQDKHVQQTQNSAP